MPELLYGDLTRAIIGAAMEVHRTLGHGFLEAVYEAALARELDLRGIPYERQKRLRVIYKSEIVGEYVADFVVDGKVVAELKATKGLTEADEAQLLNYLKATGLRVGLLLNFGTPSLEHRRRVL
ncbi:MAG: GxxExxY protein [Thermoflexales bacterium]|nr:GxxExxY protein [Thermoflexales bacterium]